MAGTKTRVISSTDLMLQLETARQQGRLKEYFNRAVLSPRLLVIDEIGYQPFGREEANLVFNVVAKRYERGSMGSRATCRSRSGQAPSLTIRRLLRHFWIGFCPMRTSYGSPAKATA